MKRRTPEDDKVVALRLHLALNRKASAVSDPAFTASNPFFDARDLVQVKYEMLRRVRAEGQPVSQAAASFGFSRPSFYTAQNQFENGGLPALVRERPGPRRAHKLSDEVVGWLQDTIAAEPSLKTSQLVELVRERFGVSVHLRSIERALERRRKKGLQSQPPSPARTPAR